MAIAIIEMTKTIPVLMNNLNLETYDFRNTKYISKKIKA